MKEKKYFEANQRLWDAKTMAHLKSAFYDLDGFMAGNNSLRKIELAELPTLEGKTVLHSQCHFGQDTMSMQRMGAQCTGFDLSPEAIKQAQLLNDQLGLSAEFVVSNVYDVDQNITETFDMVFTSYGVIGWLPSLAKWAKQLVSRLKLGGTFYMVEFHPTMYMFNWDSKTISFSYFHNETPYEEEEEGTYADKNADIKLKEYFWQHSMSDVFQALMKEGIQIYHFMEYDYSPYPIFEKEDKRADQEYLFRVNNIEIPLVYSIKGTKVS